MPSPMFSVIMCVWVYVCEERANLTLELARLPKEKALQSCNVTQGRSAILETECRLKAFLEPRLECRQAQVCSVLFKQTMLGMPL